MTWIWTRWHGIRGAQISGASWVGGVKVTLVITIRMVSISSGADLSALIREAGLACLRENLLNNATSGVKRDPPAIARRHFETAFERVSPSVTEKVNVDVAAMVTCSYFMSTILVGPPLI